MGGRTSTSTSAFGVGRRESHDATDFYARFSPPELSADDAVVRAELDEPLICGDARAMKALPDNSVALVVTSPPYFAGKEYERELGQGHVPASYLEYLQLLHDVFAECKRVLEPGGRIAVNVANLGRKPYRSLSSDVVRILQDDLQLLLRGEVIWLKARGAAGSCAWGSFRSPTNPVLRDLSERVVIASKGRFDRALSPAQRRRSGLPCEPTLTNDEFMEATLDLWEIPPERARRVGHPAPFPVELPQRLIELYTWRDDLILDPFVGVGSTCVAAVRTGRRYVGYDTDPEYLEAARRRIAAEEDASGAPEAESEPEARAALGVAEELLGRAGFLVVDRAHRPRGLGVAVALTALDGAGQRWYVDVSGGLTTTRSGLDQAEGLWRALGRAHVLAAAGLAPLLLLTSRLPPRRSAGDQALRAVGPGGFFDAVELRSAEGEDRLRQYAAGGYSARPLPGFWTTADLDRLPLT